MSEEHPQDPPSAPERGPSGHQHGHPHLPKFTFLEELKRRNVGRVAILYIILSYVVLEVFGVFVHLLDLPAWVGRSAVLLVVLGFPVALLIAWIYEITPEGLKPTDAVAPHQSIRHLTGRRLDRSIIAVLAIALSYFVIDKFWLSQRLAAQKTVAAGVSPTLSTLRAATDKSVVVLPFADLSERKDQEYFADGMAEEVRSLLAKIPGIRVIGRTSAFQFKGTNQDLRAIGARLGVAYVVEGSVRKSGRRLRVTAQLIGAQDGLDAWSDTYDVDVGNVLDLQDRIAAAIVRALQVSVGADGLRKRPMLKSTEAYDLYLRGRHSMDRFDKAGFESAANYFRDALELDPALVPAAEWLAVAHEYIAEWGFVRPAEGYKRARASVERALALDPESGVAHSLMCTINMVYDWDWANALAECNRALNLEPRNPQVLGYAGQLQLALGHWDEARRLFTAAVENDPLFAGWHDELGAVYVRTGNLAEAESEQRKTLDISPTYVRGHFYLGSTLLAAGKPAAALEEMQKETAEGGRDAGLAIVYHAMGQRLQSDAALGLFKKGHTTDMAYWLAEVHAYRREADQAFAALDRAYGEKDVDLWYFKGDPLFKNIDRDARYKAFLRKMNLPE